MILLSVILVFAIIGSLLLTVINIKMENQSAMIGWACSSIATLFWLLHVVNVL